MSKAFLATAIAATLLTASIGRAETYKEGDKIWAKFVGAEGSVVTISSTTPSFSNASVYAGPYGFWFKEGEEWIHEAHPLFCIDIYQTISMWNEIEYTVANLEAAPTPNGPDRPVMGSIRANLLRQLFLLPVTIGSETKSAYVWATEPFETGPNLYGDALSLAIWEIVFEDTLVSGEGEDAVLHRDNLNLAAGEFYAGSSDARTTAQSWLGGLDGLAAVPEGVKIWALTSPGKQDMAFYFDEGPSGAPPIPEPAVVVQLLGLGAMLGVFGLRRRAWRRWGGSAVL